MFIMAKQVLSDQQQVSQHIQKLEPSLGKIIEYIRQFILSTDPEISVMNLHKGKIMLVWPSGAKVKDSSGLLEGDFKDGRKTIVFNDLADVKTKEKLLSKTIRAWLKLVDK